MNFFERLEEIQEKNNSLVCVGLDVDIDKIPKHLLEETDPVFSFNKQVIDATHELVCAYKPNIAFYEALGLEGLQSLKKTNDYIKSLGVPIILDAKRNDIGNTAKAYARGMFEHFSADAVTVNAYMGEDSIRPFLEYKENAIFVLAKTSNSGGKDFQDLMFEGDYLYKKVVQKVLEWDTHQTVGFVVGATYPEELKEIRTFAPNSTFLVPGIGAQGGDLEGTLRHGLREDKLGLIINSSRGIIYASNGKDFAEAARNETIKLLDEINRYRQG